MTSGKTPQSRSTPHHPSAMAGRIYLLCICMWWAGAESSSTLDQRDWRNGPCRAPLAWELSAHQQSCSGPRVPDTDMQSTVQLGFSSDSCVHGGPGIHMHMAGGAMSCMCARVVVQVQGADLIVDRGACRHQRLGLRHEPLSDGLRQEQLLAVCSGGAGQRVGGHRAAHPALAPQATLRNGSGGDLFKSSGKSMVHHRNRIHLSQPNSMGSKS